MKEPFTYRKIAYVLRLGRIDEYHVIRSAFVRKLSETGRYTRIGNWWNRKGENEIDIVAVDDGERRIDFFEVKCNAARFDKAVLQRRAEEFLTVAGEFAAYKKDFAGLSLADM